MVRYLCDHPSILPSTALRAGALCLLVDVVRSNLEAGVEQLTTALGPEDMFTRLGKHLIYYRRQPAAIELEVLRILYSHATCSLRASLIASAQTNSPGWLRELITPATAQELTRLDAGLMAVAFWAACAVGDVATATVLMAAGASANAEIPFGVDTGEVVVFAAAYRGHSDVVRLIAGAADASADDVLLAACKCGLTDLALHAIAEKGAGIDYCVNQGYCLLGYLHAVMSPLGLACENGHLDAITMLLDNGHPHTACWGRCAYLRCPLVRNSLRLLAL